MTKFLVVFDVDSTLIQDEVIELLADCAGKRAEVAEVTERAMRGELDFSASLVQRVATLKGLNESVIAETYRRVRITDGAQELIDAIHHCGGKVGAVSGGFNQLLEPLAARLGLDFYRANQLQVSDGVLTGNVEGKIIDKNAKAEALLEWAASCSIAIDRTIAVGDGANDLAMMKIAGLGIAFNAKPLVREQADVVVAGSNLATVIAVLPR